MYSFTTLIYKVNNIIICVFLLLLAVAAVSHNPTRDGRSVFYVTCTVNTK